MIPKALSRKVVIDDYDREHIGWFNGSIQDVVIVTFIPDGQESKCRSYFLSDNEHVGLGKYLAEKEFYSGDKIVSVEILSPGIEKSFCEVDWKSNIAYLVRKKELEDKHESVKAHSVQ